ncbi:MULTISPECIES: hypothetical protein [Streptomyces]|uniref:Uncharacterized protein n=2 Tax=Streptomyces rapamycinicus TaxID=1226757 RepID=A0A3L8RG50_STRRN|nr:hypothetical protein [Streptomyces rapamycinicus]MBB4785958.1 hypothetical protein [Streptomyces rapamycinicus]RLV78581.1 hypothetical protein D3C57_109390 [Streptomyces rapamycinicus NRRL 5491]UTO66088.1 hypothetical protein LJB45_29735 [Streptomyces rapamycinicus]UTP34042.1 hypothetical protein LIV37_34865 [Streptomyces rapamycinicus NRRL 5491]
MRPNRICFSRTELAPHHREADKAIVYRQMARAALLAALNDSYDATFRAPVMRQAVAHPNGFVKLPLGVVTHSEGRLFLHVWLTGIEDTQAHDHRWDFSSTVLRGALYNTVLDVAQADDGQAAAAPQSSIHRVVRYQPHEGGFRFDARNEGRVDVAVRPTRVVTAGERYGMSAFTFHQARAVPGTMTLVARGAPLKRYARVLTQGDVPEERQRWRHVSQAERLGYLRDALDCFA